MTDDDDGNLANGTPNCEEICEAAALHGLGCGESCSPPETDPNASEYIIAFESPAITYSSPYSGSDPRNGVDPFGIAVSDLNNDGHKDVVLACEGSDNILVYLAQSTQEEGGPYLFQAPTAYPIGDAPARVRLRHMSLDSQAPDGYLDVIVTLQGDDGVRILLNNGDGTFDPNDPDKSRFEAVKDASDATIENPVGLRVIDFDGDGRLDIAVAGYQVDSGDPRVTLGVLWAASDGSFSGWGHRMSQLGVGHDLKAWRDTANDPWRLAVTNSDPNGLAASPKLAVFEYESSQSFSLFQNINTFVSYAVTSADFTGEGRTDLATCDSGSSTWLEQLVDTTFEAHTATGFSTGIARGMDSGKLSKLLGNPSVLDNLVDLAIAADSEKRVVVLPNLQINSSNPIIGYRLFGDFQLFALSPDPGDEPGPRQLIIVDINADGLPDMLTANRGDLGSQDASEGFSVLYNRKD